VYTEFVRLVLGMCYPFRKPITSFEQISIT